jgi:hypothetical protein
VNVEIVPVWRQVTPGLEQELVVFWCEHNAIADEALARSRAAQAVCIVRDGNGSIRGVATAVVRVLPRLRQPMYYFRMFFSPALRGHRQFLPVYRSARRILQEHNASLERAESLGLLVEVENDKLAKAYPRAYEPAFDATFIGYSPRGLQLRVSYFEGAELLPPAAPVALERKQPPMADPAVVGGGGS